MKNLWILFCKFIVIAMKFDENLISTIKEKNKKIFKANKQLFKSLETNSNTTILRNSMKEYNSFEDLKASNSLNAIIEKWGYYYLNIKYNIDTEKFPLHKLNNIYNGFEPNNGILNLQNFKNEKNQKI